MSKGKRIEAAKPVAPRRTWPQSVHENRGGLIVCALAFLVYARSLWCGFVRDDLAQIVHNPQVQSWDYLPRLLGSHLWSQNGQEETMLFYRPLFSVWMLLMHTLGGLAPWFWHLSNILLHVAATYMVFQLCRRLTGSELGAAAAAAIFAVHPIHVDAVTWVSASCEILFTICALASLMALLPSDKGAEPRVWTSALWFAAALFAKETGIILLAIVPVLAWFQLQGRAVEKKRLWRSVVPYLAITAGYSLVRWGVMHRVGVETGEHGWTQVIFSAPSIFLFYMKKLFLPWRLSGCYMNQLMASPTATFWVQLAIILVGAGAVAWFAIRRSPLLGLAATLIVVPVLPALAVIRIYPQGDMTHDRYLYVPTIGLSLLAAMLVKRLWPLGKPAKVVAAAAVIAVVGAFSVETAFQQHFYQNDIAFYSRVMNVTPSDGFARAMLGNVHLDQRRDDLAVEEFQEAHRVSPGNQKVTLFLARGLFVDGKYQDAETVLTEFLKAEHLVPRRRKAALLSLANVEIGLGNLDYAQQLLDQVEKSDDSYPELHWALGVLDQKRGLLPQAMVEYQKEVDVTGDELARQRSAAISRLIYSQSAANARKESGSH